MISGLSRTSYGLCKEEKSNAKCLCNMSREHAERIWSHLPTILAQRGPHPQGEAYATQSS